MMALLAGTEDALADVGFLTALLSGVLVDLSRGTCCAETIGVFGGDRTAFSADRLLADLVMVGAVLGTAVDPWVAPLGVSRASSVTLFSSVPVGPCLWPGALPSCLLDSSAGVSAIADSGIVSVTIMLSFRALNSVAMDSLRTALAAGSSSLAVKLVRLLGTWVSTLSCFFNPS